MITRRAKQIVRRSIRKEAEQFLDRQSARLGNTSGVVLTSTDGVLYARILNGKEIQVHNTAGAPALFDLRVEIGREKKLPNIWQILAVKQDYTGTDATLGFTKYHAPQHEFNGPDELAVNRKQITSMTVRVSDAAAFEVALYGDVVNASNGLIEIPSQLIDLSSYVVTAGAQYINIETDDDGTISIHTGTAFGSVELASVDYVPSPDPGKYLIAYVIFYEGQTTLSDDDIHVPQPIGYVTSPNNYDAINDFRKEFLLGGM